MQGLTKTPGTVKPLNKRRILYMLRKLAPRPILVAARRAKLMGWKLLHKGTSDVSWEQQFPWSSPNVWQRVVSFYTALKDPVIFEYGSGVSSFHHILNLIKQGGTYISVENDQAWYARTVQEIIAYCIKHGLTASSHVTPGAGERDSGLRGEWREWRETVFHISNGQGGPTCVAKLRLRPGLPYSGGDGGLDEFEHYVYALDQECDVIIVDGRARKACVNHVLDHGLLKPNGMLALFEAWRGLDGWMGYPALSGTSDYQPEVQRMLSLGGELVNGTGVDTWPDLKYRRTAGERAYAYPKEACFLINNDTAERVGMPVSNLED